MHCKYSNRFVLVSIGPSIHLQSVSKFAAVISGLIIENSIGTKIDLAHNNAIQLQAMIEEIILRILSMGSDIPCLNKWCY